MIVRPSEWALFLCCFLSCSCRLANQVSDSSLQAANYCATGQPTTIGASFLAKKIVIDGVVVRLQIWDTAGQERFRSMAPMYYRSAVCGILCYDITSESSFDAMHSWLLELKANLNSDIIIHFVGTKLDLVHKDPSRRAVPYEKCVQYAEKWLRDSEIVANPNWTGRDSCHEICAKDDEGEFMIYSFF